MIADITYGEGGELPRHLKTKLEYLQEEAHQRLILIYIS
jgi:hypothetical protein